MCPGVWASSATFSPFGDALPELPWSICHASITVQFPSVGALRKMQGQAAAQLHASN
jgi:hypothetical protein